MGTKRTIAKLIVATTLAVLAARPSLASGIVCPQASTPSWSEIDRAVARVELTDADLARIKALRATVPTELPKVDLATRKERDAQRIKHKIETERVKHQIMSIVGFVFVALPRQPRQRGCSGTYVLRWQR